MESQIKQLKNMIWLVCNTIIQEEDTRDRFITQMNQIEITIIDLEDQSSD